MRGVPRKNPLPKSELEICRRFREFRDGLGIRRTSFAERLNIDELALVRIEHCRRALTYAVYSKVHKRFALNPLWLKTGGGSDKMGFVIDDSDFASQIDSNALFSEVYDRFLFMQMKVSAIEEHQGVEEFLSSIQKMAADAKEGRLANVSQDLLKQTAFAANDLAQSLAAKIKEWKPIFSDYHLTNVTVSVNTPEMRARWPILKKRLQHATAVTGGKTRLAEFLGVPLASVSQWLTDRKQNAREPGAETALRMLYWVERQERK